MKWFISVSCYYNLSVHPILDFCYIMNTVYALMFPCKTTNRNSDLRESFSENIHLKGVLQTTEPEGVFQEGRVNSRTGVGASSRLCTSCHAMIVNFTYIIT